MSKQRIEKEIVQLMFDAKDFAKGIKNSIDQLGDLKKSINMDQQVKAFSDLETAADVDMTPLGKSLDKVSFKMRALATTAGIMMADIIKSVAGSVKGLADTLVLEPIKTGLEEYETQINAVQTILANTAKAGTTLADVTAALDELNEYADLTIYNFTEMTKNIGTFTAAGVDLDTSVAAIKGIANLAAVSGSSAQQAAGGMYQLSQAIASGTVKLMDWNSVQTAGLGGQIFKDALVETAKVHGIAIDNIIARNEGFRNSLQEGWLSTEILLETLQKFTGDLSEAQLEQMGYTEEQIAGIIELGQIANDSATKIKTFTALKDNLKEVLQSGWSQTWRIILGDFEQAKELWGRVAEVFGGVLEASAKSRNRLLQAWANVGGRDKLLEGFFNLLDAGLNVLKAFNEAIGEVFRPLRTSDLLKITIAFRDFSEKIKMGSENLWWFKGIVKGVASIIKILGLAVGALLFPFKFLVPILELAVKGFLAWLGLQGEAIYQFAQFAEKTGYFITLVQQGIAYLKIFADWLGVLVDQFLELEQVQAVVQWFRDLKPPVVDLEKVWASLQKVLMALVAPFYLVAKGAELLYIEFRKLGILEEVVAWFNAIDWEGIAQDWQDIVTEVENFYNEIRAIDWNKIGQDIKDMGQEVKDFFIELRNSELLSKFLTLLNTYDGRRFNEFMDEGQNNFQWLIDAAKKFKDELTGMDFTGLTDGIKKIRETIGNALNDILDYLIKNADEIDYTQLFDVINAGLLTGILIAVRKIASGDFLSDILGEDSFFGEILEDSFDRLNGTLQSFQNNIRADTLQKIAVSIALLAGAITLMTLIDETKLGQAAGAIALMVASLFGSAGALKTIKPHEAIQASIAITGLAAAVTLFSIALNAVSLLDPEETAIGMGALTGALLAMVGALAGMNKFTGTAGLKTIAMLIGLGQALTLLTGVIWLLGQMDPAVLAQGMAAVGAALYGLTWALVALDQGAGGSKLKASLAMTAIAVALARLIPVIEQFGTMDLNILAQGLATVGVILLGLTLFTQKLKVEKLLEAGIGLAAIAASLWIVTQVVAQLGNMNLDQLTQGMLAVGAALFILVFFANAMQGTIVGAQAILIMSVALIAIAAAVYILGQLEWKQLGVALVAIAGVFVILGAAGYLLAPIIPFLIGLGIAMALIGVGALAMGFGLFLAATGLVALGASGPLAAHALVQLGKAIIELLPGLATAFANAIANFIVTMAERAPEVIAAFMDMIRAFITGITELIPDIVGAIFEMIVAILEKIAEELPKIVQAGYDILLAVIKGIGDNIAEVVAAGLYVLTEFIAGIEEGIPALVDQAFSTLLTFLEAIEEAVDTYMADIIEIGIDIGLAIVDGLVDGLGKGIPKIKDKIVELAQAAWDRLVKFWDNKSPSKRTERLGTQIVQGLINGLDLKRRELVNSFAAMADSAYDAIKPVIQRLAEEVDRNLDLAPVIRPVLDADDFQKRSAEIFAEAPQLAYSLASNINRDVGQSARAADTTDLSGTARPNVQYVQNNYSPKALDRATIYRQTKTHVAKLKHEELM